MKSNKVNRELGQGLVEYALVIVLVTIVAMAVIMLIGPVIGNTFDQAEFELTTPANRGASAQAQASLQALRAAAEEIDENYAKAQDGFVKVVSAAVEFLQGTWAGADSAGQFEAFLQAIQNNDPNTALTIAGNVDLSPVSPEALRDFLEGQAGRLSRSYEYLREAEVTAEFYELYDQARADFEELPDGDQASLLLEEILGHIEQREAQRKLLVLEESDVLSIIED